VSSSSERQPDSAVRQPEPEAAATSPAGLEERSLVAPLFARRSAGIGMNGAMARAVAFLQRTAGNRAAAGLLQRQESEPAIPLLEPDPAPQLQVEPDSGVVPLQSPPAATPAAVSVKMLVIYTGGDTRATGKKGRQVEGMPKTYEELYRQRAIEVGGASAVVKTFATIDDAKTWLNDPANKGITEIRFVGHGDPGIFAFSVTPKGQQLTASANQLLSINTPDASFVQAIAAAVPAVKSGGGSGKTVRTVNIHIEACNTGGGALGNFATAMGAAGLSGKLSGYDVDVLTTYKGALRRTVVTDKQGSESGLQQHLKDVTVP
jgi:hypothetical protein